MFGHQQKMRASCKHPASARPCLEELEDHVTPVNVIPTATNVAIQITPNLSNFSVTETVTAKVTTVPQGLPAIPATVFFNLNNQQQQAQLDSNGQATATFSLPLLALFASQELTVQYSGGPSQGGLTVYGLSNFNAPVYLNFDNLLLPANVTFNPLPPQQPSSTSLPPYNTAQGETDSFGPLVFHYSDPGVITSVEVFGHSLPGSFAASFGAYGPEFMPNNGTSS